MPPRGPCRVVRVRHCSFLTALFLAGVVAGAEFVLRAMGARFTDRLRGKPALGLLAGAEPKSCSSRTAQRSPLTTSGYRASNAWGDGSSMRILFVGDSVTYGGSYIDDSELFTTLGLSR